MTELTYALVFFIIFIAPIALALRGLNSKDEEPEPEMLGTLATESGLRRRAEALVLSPSGLRRRADEAKTPA
jgi:hypothetical protein